MIDRLLAVRAWASTPSGRRMATTVALALFVVTGLGAWRALPDDHGPIDMGSMVVVAVLVVPGVVVNAEEFRVSARLVGQSVSLARATRVAVLAAAANLLPIPGSMLVRTDALRRDGATMAAAAGATVVVGVAYLGTALVAAGAAVGAANPVAASACVTAGVVALVGVHRLARIDPDEPRGRVLAWLVAVEAASVLVKATRLFLVIRALGFDPSVPQAAVVSMATVAASAVGVFPGGLGLREVLAGALGPIVGLPAAVGLVATAVDRVVGLAVLSVVAAVVLNARFGPAIDMDAAGDEA